ncbi:MAG: DHH family phosphoesterase, partial [candidate division Zixibacteria bacterium]|nr:DHH family phosphoesterase [candidate division Zixibacteria bacterium]
MRSRTIRNNSEPSANDAALMAEIAAFLKAARRIMVASHVDPDGDALGTQLAFAAYARHLGKDVFLVRDGDIPEKYRFLPDIADIRHVSEFADDFRVDTALVLECPDIARVGLASRYLTDGVKIINIDHHYDNSSFGALNWLNTSASSVGEMAFEYFAAAGYEIDAGVAEQLYTAIMTDTGRFRFASTSPRTMRIVADLI